MNVTPLIVKAPFSAQFSTTTNFIVSDFVTISNLSIMNLTSAAAFVQIFTVAASKVTLGTTTPYCTIPLAASGGYALDSRWKIPSVLGTYSMAGTTIATGSSAISIQVFALYE